MWGRALRLCYRTKSSKIHLRTFLSSAYRCDDVWSSRSSSRALRSIKPDELYIKMEQRSNKQSLSPIDLDVFSHCATVNHLGELRDLLHKLRCTAFAHQIFPSTCYATLRIFNQAGEEGVPDLIQILDDRLNYGVYLDRFTASMIFDDILKRENYEAAARIAGFLMLQENFESPIVEDFALYSAYKYLKIPIPPRPIEEPSKEPPKKQKKPEEIKIRVGYLRNPFFDNHFDLTDVRQIAGKTLSMITSKKNDSNSIDCNLLGWLSYKKYEKAKVAAEKIVKKGSIYKETNEILKNIIETHDSQDEKGLKKLDEISTILNPVTTSENSIDEEIKQKLSGTIKKYEKDEIEEHKQTLKIWEEIREAKLEEQLKMLENIQKEKARKEREDIIKDLDERIWFFDNEDAVDLKIAKKEVKSPETTVVNKTTKKKIKVDDTYVPPEIWNRA